MTEQELREKIARIIAKHLCKNRYSHFQLYGDLANCYSRENFAECEAIADTVDALISEGIGDVSEYKYRAEVAERALQIADELGELCGRKEDYVQQAEKELEEERKDDDLSR